MSTPTNSSFKSTKDRYRPIFCSPDYYLQNLLLFEKCKIQFQNLAQTEKVQAWVTLMSLLRRPEDWFGGLRKTPLTSSKLQHTYSLKNLLQKTHLIWPKNLNPEINLLTFLNEVKIKALPDSCLISLIKLTHQDDPLQIIFEVPKPLELLNYQLQGKRIISFNEDVSTWPTTLYHGRDFLSFMIHDLIHANHFFSSPENRHGQLGFYRSIKQILNDPELKILLQNEDFRNGFEYIISDMNSHPVHLFKTLHAKILQTTNDLAQTQIIWKGWTEVWSNQNLSLNSALQKVNTQLFSDIEALELETHSIALGYN
jgi:hypothetical protein